MMSTKWTMKSLVNCQVHVIKIIYIDWMKIKVKVIQGQPFAEEVFHYIVTISKKCSAFLNNGAECSF